MEDKLLKLSKDIWKATLDEDVETLNKLIHHDCKFVHMGVTLKHDEEVEVIKNKIINYQNIDFDKAEVSCFGDTYVVLTKMKLTAIVKGNEAINDFVVTEVYKEFDNEIKMISLAYTKINY